MSESPSLRDAPLFASVDGQTLQRLTRDSKVEYFHDGATIFRQGDRALCVVVVLDGYVKLSSTSACGDETLVNICSIGESLYEALTPDGENYRIGAEAIGEVCAMKLSAARFRDALRDSSSLCGAVIAEASRKVSALIGEIESLKGLNADQRLARFILSLCPPGEDSCCIRLPYDKRLIAARLGVKQETLSRSFARLRDVGVRTEMRDVLVESVPRLAAECFGDNAASADRRETADSRDTVA
ncbi:MULTISPECIES: Crp/Fnr family transcriptional regulator [Methylosinus]|uniref:Crp/Fnr family transcriptional regulator n=1 Tax=Methylosinus trichosporium (strain ATCC 35070 / NCIMB 11131 / UNIQEM 75 / OB3b) TaxID=595536 RepID=A0A2D2D307_METT3|nr:MULTISPECIES: Crp/Fnr family transcriptional regulator [Methylosinus]ATQ69392.1 Crp/Fnr family transcriptional regulator [Methylosinus trichosporium OB3b]